MASLREIARSAGVSVATVSRALNNSTEVSAALRERVLVAAEKAGYAKPAAPKRVGRIGLVYPGEPVNPEFGGFDASVIAGAMRGCIDHSFDLCVINMLADRKPGETHTQFFRRKGLDAVLIRTYSDRRRVCEEIAEEGFPHVVLGDRFDHPGVSFACYDSEVETAAAIDHLVHLGHTRIAMCIHVVQDTDHAQRRRAFTRVLERRGLAVDPELIVEVIADLGGGCSAVNRLMSLPEPPTAIFFTDPLATVGGLRRALELEIRVPEELSIVGYDDGELRRFTHPVYTAVCGDANELARGATAWLARSLDGNADPLRQRKNAYFEVNNTTAAARAGSLRVSPDGRRL